MHRLGAQCVERITPDVFTEIPVPGFEIRGPKEKVYLSYLFLRLKIFSTKSAARCLNAWKLSGVPPSEKQRVDLLIDSTWQDKPTMALFTEEEDLRHAL